MWREEQPWLSGLSLSSSQDHQCCNLEAKYFPNHMARKFKGSKNFTFTLTKKSDRFIRFFWNGPTCINTSHAIYFAAFVVWGWNFPFKISLSHVQLFTHFKTFIHFSAPHNITQELTQFNFQFSTLFKVRLGPRNVFVFVAKSSWHKSWAREYLKKSLIFIFDPEVLDWQRQRVSALFPYATEQQATSALDSYQTLPWEGALRALHVWHGHHHPHSWQGFHHTHHTHHTEPP